MDDLLLVTSVEWPRESLVNESLRKMRIREYEVRKILLPYYSVSYDVLTERGISKGGRTAVNASFLDFPKKLDQAIPLFRPSLLKQEVEKGTEDALAFPVSKLGIESFFLNISSWARETEEKIREVRESIRKIYSTLRLKLIFPAPPGFSVTEKKYSKILSKLLGQKYGINLILGLGFGDSIKEISVGRSELFYSKAFLVESGGDFLILEVSEKGVEPLSGLSRLIEEVPEAENYLRTLIHTR